MPSLIITAVRQQARAIRSFDLMPEGADQTHGISFVPGQVAVLEIEGDAPGYFAFASAPEDPELEVLVKQNPGTGNRIFDMQVEIADILATPAHASRRKSPTLGRSRSWLRTR